MQPDLPHGVREPEPDPIEPLSEDTFHRVYFGQVADPLVRPHPEPPEAEEDELTRAALGDPEGARLNLPATGGPTPWRMVVLLLIAAGALAWVFGRR